MEAAIDSPQQDARAERPQLSAWLWCPWYAKLWWSAIPIWWIGLAVSARVGAFEPFYRGALAGYLNVLFFPMTALMVLGVGYVRERLEGFMGQGDGTSLSDEEALASTERIWDEHDRAMKNLRAGSDVFDPRSGTLWIGNAANPNNAAYINPHTGRHS